MIVALHGFDWGIYAERIMPAFAHWLIHEDETAIYQLYQETRHAQEEQFVPKIMRGLRCWPRAQELVHTLPRGQFARLEYQKLCAAEAFTALSDRYVHRHPPQLLQISDAIRTVWGALVEEYCLPWLPLEDDDEASSLSPSPEADPQPASPLSTMSTDPTQTMQGELIALLHAAGMDTLAQEVSQQVTGSTETDKLEDSMEDEDDEEGENNDEDATNGIALGPQPATLHLRGWLASISVRAMALFELLACGRRSMPFGYEPGESLGSFIGYLTPNEVWQLALCLHDVAIPGQSQAIHDFEQFRTQRAAGNTPFRMIDEVLPSHAHPFVKAVRSAAMQGLGLICSVG